MQNHRNYRIIHVCFWLLAAMSIFASFSVRAQEGWSAAKFADMSNEQRYRYVHNYPFYKIDSGALVNSVFVQMRDIAQKKGDNRAELAIDFYNCFSSGNVGVKTPGGISSDSLFHTIENRAKRYGFPIEETVARFYLTENAANSGKISYEQRYTALMRITEHMQQLGYQNFRDYYIENMMLRTAMVMWDLDDREKAYLYLSIAERFVATTEEGNWYFTQVMSYLQTYWKIKKDYRRSLAYAFKIKNFHDHYRPVSPGSIEHNNFWRGFSTIEIADLLVKQGKVAESEQYADKGYMLSKAPPNALSNFYAFQAEYDALIVLVDVKLSLGKLQQAGALLQRAQQLKSWLEAKKQLDYFKPLRLYRYLAEYNERKGNSAVALSYIKQADLLQDSLTRRNDAHKLARAQQRLESEKYAQKIAEVEKEKRLEKTLRQAALVILALVLIVGFMYYKRAQAIRKQKESELEATKQQLLQQTQILREKSEQADNLHAEMEKLSATGQRSEYLEQLTRATILTDDDWASFRTLFEKVYPNFISEQKQLYPGITPAEIRLAVLDKLELNTNEMANMLGVSKNTIHQTRVRLRKKMENNAS
ncbi:tetratricopeptide repeat protein [Mucilaginibacter pedocola]|uniref:HTH luxR-type domain-containing protein n=1 Tax=Mucilaginibacter pedocola TaxID=1792845 RepID=A0A1S9P7V0_9SPHI|nr:hypothetical protein [Mucilaginibacter pedocola]OOQ57035.1 hypothetical protein BC343_15990 [Mucilaginibacter pedocola]